MSEWQKTQTATLRTRYSPRSRRAGDGSDGNIRENFSGTIDVKAFLDHLVSQRNYSGELWLTRMEVGSEIDDDTSGTVSMNNITFQVNDQIRSAVIGE